MTESSSSFSNPAYFVICILVVVTPMLMGAVNPWAETLIQMLALTGVVILILEKCFGGAEKTDSGEGKKVVFCVMLPVISLALFSAVFSQSRMLALEGVIMLLTYLAIFYITVNAVRTRKEQRILVYIIIGMAMFLSLFGMLKLFDMNFLGLWEYGIHQNVTSLTGPYVNRNHMAGFLDMAIPVLLGFLMTRERSREVWLGLIAVVLFLIITQAMTLSRGGWIATLSAMGFMVVVLMFQKSFQHKQVLIWIVVGALVVGVIVLASTPVVKRVTTLTQQDSEDTMAGRTRIWEGTIQMIKDNLFTGTGPGTFTEMYPAYQEPGASVLAVYAHNDYLHFIADCGVLAVPVMIWLLFLFFRAGVKKMKRRSRQTRGFTLGCMAAVVAIMVHSYSDFNLHIPANIILFTVLSAMVLKPDRGV